MSGFSEEIAIDPYVRRRKILLKDLDLQQLTGVEIGPLNKPLVRRSDGSITYVDHATRTDLVNKYAGDANVNTDEIVDIDAVWGERSLAQVVGDRFADYVVASHVVEHVPDFLGWMQEIQAVLKTGGELMLVVPDKRMSFDCQRRETVATVVLDAFVRRARKPQTYQIVDCALGVVRSDAWKMYLGHEAPEDYRPVHTMAQALALAENALKVDAYVDVHCWVFTPKSFARLLQELVGNDLLEFACSGFTDTHIDNNFEFFVKLQTGQSRDRAVESWRAMEHSATHHVIGSAAQRRAAKAL